MVVVVGRIKGIPNPVVLEEPESSPESPIITYSYYVTYEFAKGEKVEEKEGVKVYILHILLFCFKKEDFLLPHPSDRSVGYKPKPKA